ncbi:hypothetical protein Pmani_008267 [Petrolisthes manimaculis]|uniref:Endonuclease/exonuclease/phosphatase domain-containing protein n=1 Tax=Petrolisthes manimaculis TaxID=1843537 RepID=A0AAE1Q6Y4_9EUCA|nr:hypothetical protein Pmani_008267 [Petrolisthes manimaculis]
MVTVNIDVSDGLANGVCGTVVGIDNTGADVHAVLVKLDSLRVGIQAIDSSQYKRQYPCAVPIKRKDVQFYAGRGRRSVEAQCSQFPLTLAWGCTIHKQLTFSLLLSCLLRHLWISIHLLNARSYLEHLQDMQADPILVSTDFFCFVETFPRKGQQLRERELILPGSASFRTDRPPSGNSTAFIDKLQRLMQSLPTGVLTVILGDFNFNLIDYSHHKILRVMEQFGFHQHVKTPTKDYDSLLDHVYVNS